MLSISTVEPRTLDVLRTLTKSSLLSKARLVGGTSLALQIGHRKSIDLDFFGEFPESPEELKQLLRNIGTLSVIKESFHIKIYMLDGIKVDFVNYLYEWIDEPVIEEGICLASVRDIAAMKVNAVEGRGTKKDFIDIYFLLQQFTLQEILDFYVRKYPENSIFRALMSLTYFDDADLQLPPEMCIPVEWEEMKRTITNAVKAYGK